MDAILSGHRVGEMKQVQNQGKILPSERISKEVQFLFICLVGFLSFFF